MATILFVPHHGRPEAAQVAKETIEKLERAGHKALVLESDASKTGLEQWAMTSLDGHNPDLAVSLGGDGTMLRTFDLISATDVPVLGVNIGHLGYLTEIEPPELETALEGFFTGKATIVERMRLQVDITTSTKSGSAVSGSTMVVNEVVVEKAAGSTVRLQVSIAGKPFLSYAVDGMIIATPTGSTAYNLSARGPIVSPSVEAILMTPVSAHMLFDRALVLSCDEELTLEVLGPRDAAVVVDGRPLAVLQPGDIVRCTRSPRPARLVTFREHDIRDVLKAKFGLADR
jgi:NAD+ kinase